MHALSLLLLTLGAPPDDAAFEKSIRPLFVEKCVKCHGPDKASGKLRLDTRDGLLKGGESGPALIAHKPAESLLMKAVRRHAEVSAMPPDKALEATAIAALEKWIGDGAPWPATAAPVRAARHWAFEPLQVPKINTVAGSPIDSLLVAKREPAERRVFIRRATFDLTGLPPAPAEIETYLADASTNADAKLIDRLLASPRYGEKWGRQWLDVVRYADTAGETADFPVPDAWRYRNYVIDAFNRDVPFDQFIREQLAGDILASRLPPNAPPARYAELLAATGYLAVARRFGFDVAKDHFLTLEDTIDTVGKSLLGLTIACARCHDHKYDPISAQDYYALYGIFESTRFPLPGCEKEKTQRHLVPLSRPLDEPSHVVAALMGLGGGRPWVEAVRQGQQARRPTTTAYAVWEGEAHDAALHKRGDPEVRGEAVPRRFLTVLGGQPLPPQAGSGRLALADWIVEAKNPLAARVLVNRLWQGHFGLGLVDTPNDFGTRGSPPSHPALLDWLAAEFIRSGWSIKAMHRQIMLSAAYRRSDFPRRRLTAEEMRDALLFVSGELDESPSGPHPFPDAKTWGYTQHAPFVAVYETNRRSVYLMTQRIKRHPFLALFDGADPNASTASRQTTTVPPQALFFMNDPFVHARAASLAKRLTGSDTERLQRACEMLYGRSANESDLRIAKKYLATGGDWGGWLRVMLSSSEFVYVD